MCGFDCTGVFKAEDEFKLFNNNMFYSFQEDMQEYVSGWVTEEDFEEDEEADALTVNIEEISEEEYLESVEDFDDGIPYHVG